MAMPADPIEFLALWLLKHVQDEERKNKVRWLWGAAWRCNIIIAQELAERDEIERRRAELEKKVAEEEMAKERARKEKADEEERAKAAEASAKQQRLEAYLTLDDERRAGRYIVATISRIIAQYLEIEADLEHEKEERVAKEAAVAEGQEGAEPPPPEDPIAKYRMRYAHRVKDLEVALSPAFIKEVGHLEVCSQINIY